MIEWLFSYQSFVLAYCICVVVNVAHTIYFWPVFNRIMDDLSATGKAHNVLLIMILTLTPIVNGHTAVMAVIHFYKEIFEDEDCEL